jgi:hypothetical protein
MLADALPRPPLPSSGRRAGVVRSRVVVGVNSGVVLALGLALLVPLALSLLYRDGSWASFLIPAAAMIPLGAAGLSGA